MNQYTDSLAYSLAALGERLNAAHAEPAQQVHQGQDQMGAPTTHMGDKATCPAPECGPQEREVIERYSAMAGFMWGDGQGTWRGIRTATRAIVVPRYDGDYHHTLVVRAMVMLRTCGTPEVPANAAVTHFELKPMELP